MPIPGRVVVIENALIDSLLRNPAYAEFANCLDVVRNAGPAAGCRRCGRAPGKDASAYNAAKLCLVGMPQGRRDRLKQLLGAATVRLVVSQAGRVVPYDI